MELSNLRPAKGSVHSDNFRRGRGHGSGNGKTAGKGHKGQKARSGAPESALRAVRCLWQDVFPNAASTTSGQRATRS